MIISNSFKFYNSKLVKYVKLDNLTITIFQLFDISIFISIFILISINTEFQLSDSKKLNQNTYKISTFVNNEDSIKSDLILHNAVRIYYNKCNTYHQKKIKRSFI